MSLSDRERLSVNLKVAREARGVSQGAAAEAVGKSRGTIVNWENPANTAEPSSDEVETLAKLYGLTTAELRHATLVRQSAAPAPQVVASPDTGEGGRDWAARVAKEKAAKRGGRKNGKG
jgi:transcriptional regulator with XRE-family HTH domain